MGEETEKLLSSDAPEEAITAKQIAGQEAIPSAAKEDEGEEEQVKQAVEATVVPDEAREGDVLPPPEEPPVAPSKDESYFVKDLKEYEKKALRQLKAKIEEAIKNNTMLAPPKPVEVPVSSREVDVKEEKKVDEANKEEEVAVEEKAKDLVAVVEEAKETAIVEKAKEHAVTVIEEGAESVAEAKGVCRPADVGATSGDDVVKDVAKKVTEVEASSETESQHPSSLETDGVHQVDDESASLDDLALWGVPLLPSKGDERTDIILLKFLRARDFKVNDVLSMLQDTMLWRKSFGADGLLDEEITREFESIAYMHGFDKEGHPVCYNHFGVLQDKELYQKTFEDNDQFNKFLRWRVQVLEKGIKMLDFSPTGVHSILQITDFKDSPGLFKVRNLTKKALNLLQDNYPELVAKQIFLNVPWYFGALYNVFGKIVTPRSKSKVVIATPGKVTETLYRYISPKDVPVHYGGLSKLDDTEFDGIEAPVTEIFVKAGEIQTVEILVESGSTVVWDMVVVGWDITYSEEFVPSAEGSYTVIIQKPKKLAVIEEPLRNSFKATEAGKVVLTVDATISKRKKHVVYRHATKKHLDLEGI